MQSRSIEEFNVRHFLDIGDAKVCYRKAGEGPPLVLVHGFPLSGMTWRKLIPELSRHFTCYAFDVIGFGDSISSSSVDFSSQGQGRVLQGVLRALGVTSYALIGNDSGGWIARELALLEPQRVTRLVLTNTEMPGHRPPWIPLYQVLARMPGASLLFRALLASRWFRHSSMAFGGCFVDPAFIDGEFNELYVLPLRSSPGRISSAMRFLAHMNFQRVDAFRELHRQLTMPVGFVWGADDPTFPEKIARGMAAQFPNVLTFRSIPNAKLFLQEEQPDALAEQVLELLIGGG